MIEAPAYTPQEEQMALEQCDEFMFATYVGLTRVSYNAGPATSKKYQPGVSVYARYTSGYGCHVIIKNGRAVHGPHVQVPKNETIA